MHQFHAIFDSNKKRYSIKVRTDGHVSFRDLTGHTTGVSVTPEQEAVLNKIVAKLNPLLSDANIPTAGAAKVVKTVKAKPGRPAKAAKVPAKAPAKARGRKKAA